jgi:hypothetical protein
MMYYQMHKKERHMIHQELSAILQKTLKEEHNKDLITIKIIKIFIKI